MDLINVALWIILLLIFALIPIGCMMTRPHGKVRPTPEPLAEE